MGVCCERNNSKILNKIIVEKKNKNEVINEISDEEKEKYKRNKVKLLIYFLDLQC